MKIKRQAIHKYWRIYKTRVTLGDACWQPRDKTVRCSDVDVTDFYGKNRHSWTIRFTLEELRDLIDAVASGVSDDDVHTIGKAMAPSLPAILRIAQAAASYLSTPENGKTLKPSRNGR